MFNDIWENGIESKHALPIKGESLSVDINTYQFKTESGERDKNKYENYYMHNGEIVGYESLSLNQQNLIHRERENIIELSNERRKLDYLYKEDYNDFATWKEAEIAAGRHILMSGLPKTQERWEQDFERKHGAYINDEFWSPSKILERIQVLNGLIDDAMLDLRHKSSFLELDFSNINQFIIDGYDVDIFLENYFRRKWSLKNTHLNNNEIKKLIKLYKEFVVEKYKLRR